MLSVVDVLRGARALITPSTAYTTTAIARTAEGRECSATHPDAREFNLVGAIIRASNRNHALIFEAQDIIKQNHDSVEALLFPHIRALSVLDRAIQFASQHQPRSMFNG